MFTQLNENLKAQNKPTFSKGTIVDNGVNCGVEVVTHDQSFTAVTKALNALYWFNVAANRYPDAFNCIDWDWGVELENTLLKTSTEELAECLTTLTEKVKLAHQANNMFAACGEQLELNWLDMSLANLKKFHNSTHHWMMETIYI